jgi:general secretion pathway protein G
MISENRYKSAFTIVELLVVIVVIGILAAITIVTYSNISQKAIVASIQSDLSSAQTQLKLFLVDNGSYPNSVTDCPIPSTGNLCLKTSSGNTFSSYSANNTTNPQTYSLSEMHGSSIYTVTNTTVPTTLASAPLSPVADWLAMAQGDHYGNYYDLVSKQWATVNRAGAKTIYDPATQHIYDVPTNYLGVSPRSDGKSGSEAVIEEGRTNYVLNSYGSANNGTYWTTGWGVNGTIVGTPTYSLVKGVYSNSALRIRYTGQAGDSNSRIYLNSGLTGVGTFAPGDSATGDFYMKGSVIGTAYPWVLVDSDTSGGAYNGEADYAPVPITNSFALYSKTYSSMPVNTSQSQLQLIIANINPGDTIDITIDAAQLEKGSFATSYIPTTATTVTRNADIVKVPTTNWNNSNGTFIGVVDVTPSFAGSANYIGLWGESDANRIWIDQRTGGYPSIGLYNAGVGSMAYGSSVAPTNPYVAAMTWNSGGSDTPYQNSTPGSPMTGYSTPSLGSTAYIGSGYNGYYFNGPIQRLAVYNSALTSGNVSTVTNAIQNGP